MNGKYDDIINLPHHTSKKHQPMSRSARAAQFAPFAAITGLDDELEETARLTDKKIVLDEAKKEILNRDLIYLRDHLQSNITATVTFFRSDGRKDGGAYIAKRITVRKIDEIARKLITENREEIDIDDIFSITIHK